MENRKYIYTNSAEIIHSLYDVQFVLETKSVNKGEVFSFEEPIILVMSPSHAKALSKILVNSIKEYEKEFGEIALPKEKTE